MRPGRSDILTDVAAHQANYFLALRSGASHIDVVDVVNGNLTWVGCAGRVVSLVALVDDDGKIASAAGKVLEGHILNIPTSTPRG